VENSCKNDLEKQESLLNDCVNDDYNDLNNYFKNQNEQIKHFMDAVY